MKKFIIYFSLAAVFVAGGCTEKPAEKEVIIVPVHQEPAQIIIEKEKPANTSITFDKKGVKVEAKEIDIKIEK